MIAKQLFLRDKPLAGYWVAIARADDFARVCTYARAELMEGRPTQEQLTGAEMILDVLTRLADNEEPDVPFPSPGLHHNIDSKRRE